MFLLLSARPHELPETVLSRCHVVTFAPLSEPFVVGTLTAEGAEPERAALLRDCRGNLGRARRLAVDDEGLAFREVARRALERSGVGPAGALEAAETVLVAAERYRKALTASLKDDLAPFLDDAGQPEEAYGAVRRLEERHKRRVRRAERDYVDWVLLAASAILRDRVVAAVGGGGELLMNPDITPAAEPVRVSAAGVAALEEARAALAEELNLNVRLVVERAFCSRAPPETAQRPRAKWCRHH